MSTHIILSLLPSSGGMCAPCHTCCVSSFGISVCIFIASDKYNDVLVFVSVPAELEVYVLNTEMDLQDLSFPQSYASESTIQLSASTIKQYSRNGQCG